MKIKQIGIALSLIMAITIFTMTGCPEPDPKPDPEPEPTVPAAAVTSVTVSPKTPNVEKGGSQQFTATVTGTNNPAQTVTWTIETAGKNAGTAIDSTGKLTVAAAETLTSLTVKATSTVDTSKSDTATVGIIDNSTGNLIVYPFPNGMPKYTNITLKADETTIDLYSVKVNNTYLDYSDAQNNRDNIPIAMFDMKGPVQIEITLPVDPSTVIIRPLSSEITPVINNKTITFTISEPNQYSVEYNNTPGNPKNAILIFANPNESFSGTTVVEAGIHTQNYTVNSGQTLYLKPGAVVRGKVVMNSNSKIVGRGIIDGSHLQDWKSLGYNATLPIETYAGNNLEINGISIFDSNAWNIQLQNASNVKISNVKIVASRYNSDGISIQSSNNVTVENCFIRTWDDGIAVKNYSPTLNSHTITIKNVRFWTDLAQSLEIGFETNKGNNSAPKINNVKFEDITIFHVMHKAPISIHNGDNADISDITFKNIIIENYQPGNVNTNGWNYLIDISNLTSSDMGGAPDWTTVTARGNISNVLIENVKIISGKTDPGWRFDSSGGGSVAVTLKDIFNVAAKMTFTTSSANVTLTNVN